MCDCSSGNGLRSIKSQPTPKAGSVITNPRTARINQPANQQIMMPKRTTKLITPIKVKKKNA